MDKQASKRRRTSAAARIDSKWSLKPLAYAGLLMIAGFVLTSTVTTLTSPSTFQDVLFGSGILCWIIGVLGAAYYIVRRLAGPKAAKLAVGALLLALIIKLIFGERDD